MLLGVERLVDLVGTKTSGLTGLSKEALESAVQTGDTNRLAQTDGHFAVALRNHPDGQTVRLARTIGLPLRYFVAKRFHGPFLVVSDRIDSIFNWCQEQKIGWQFDPLYTRMAPAHYLTEIDQIGCPDPAPRYTRFWNPALGQGTLDMDEAGANYACAAYQATKNWLQSVPDGEPIGVAFSGGIDSTSVFLMARKALSDMGRDTNLLRAFTLDLGGGADAAQAETVARELGFENQWEVIRAEPSSYSLETAISVLEDYHPLDVECAAAALCLLGGIKAAYPSLRYLLDGDGGDENLKSYPLEDSDLTLSSVFRNPLLYQEGWGVEKMKHSQTYSGGLSRAYVRTFAPAAHYGYTAFSPYTVRSVMDEAVAIPFEAVLDSSVARLYTLKQEVVQAGMESLTGIKMPVSPKRRFQDGAGGDSYRAFRVSKAWCRQVFLRQWEGRLKSAWNPEAGRISGNTTEPLLGVPAPAPSLVGAGR